MIQHLVLLTLRPGVDAQDPRILEACRLEEVLAERYTPAGGALTPAWRFGRDIGRRPISADFVGVGLFDSMASLREFLDSEEHQQVVAAWGDLVDILIADIEVD